MLDLVRHQPVARRQVDRLPGRRAAPERRGGRITVPTVLGHILDHGVLFVGVLRSGGWVPPDDVRPMRAASPPIAASRRSAPPRRPGSPWCISIAPCRTGATRTPSDRSTRTWGDAGLPAGPAAANANGPRERKSGV